MCTWAHPCCLLCSLTSPPRLPRQGCVPSGTLTGKRVEGGGDWQWWSPCRAGKLALLSDTPNSPRTGRWWHGAGEGRLREGERFASVAQLEAAEPGLKPRSTLTHCSTQPCDLKATQTSPVTSSILQIVSLPAYLHVWFPLSPTASSEVGEYHLIVSERGVDSPQVIQFSSVTQSCPTLYDPMDCSMPDFPVHHQLPEPTQAHVHRIDDAVHPFHPLSSPSPSAFNLSQNQGFSSESVLRIRWPKYWSFSFSISPFNEYSGLISFRMDWLDLLAVQGTLKSLLQNHGSKASILWYSAFFTVQLSHPYITTGKTIALTKWIFVSKWISLLFNTIWSSNSTPGYKFRKKLNSHLERYMHPNAYSRTSHNRQDMEATQMPINSYIKTIWLRKCSINIHSGILFIQKEMKFFYCSKVNEPREFYA